MTQAKDMLDFYLRAEQAVLQGQTVRYGERLLTRADLADIRKGRQEWQAVVDREAAGPRRARFSVADFGGHT